MAASRSDSKDKNEAYSLDTIKQLFTTSPRELYIIYVLKLLESFNYFTFTLLYPFYLTDEFGVNDEQTGVSLGILGTVSLVYGILLSPAIDYVGAKPCLLLSFLMSATCRLGLAFAPNQDVFFGLAYGPMSVAFALGMPVLMIAIKKYTPQRNWGMAYALYYSMMNVAALFSGFCLDLFTIQLKSGLGTGRGFLAFSNGYRTLMALASVTSTVAALVVLCLRDPSEVRKEQLNLLGYSDMDEDDDAGCAKLGSFKDRTCELLQGGLSIVRDWEFWKFMAVCVITINMRSLFRHLDFTMPKYVKRAFGCSAPSGTLYSINPMVVIVMVPIIGILTNHISHFDIIHLGSYVHATSAFWLAGFQQIWAVVLFVLQLSLGEAMWSPRWYDYSMSVAPNGREGLFVALAAAPLFFSKLPTGFISGWLLQHFCPENKACSYTSKARKQRRTPPPAPGVATPLPQPCRGHAMWLFIGLIAITSPIMLLIFYKWLKPASKPSHSQSTVTYSKDDEAWAAEIPIIDVGHVADRAAEAVHVSQGKTSIPPHSKKGKDDTAPLLPCGQAKSD